MSDESLSNILNSANYVRYIAGLPELNMHKDLNLFYQGIYAMDWIWNIQYKQCWIGGTPKPPCVDQETYDKITALEKKEDSLEHSFINPISYNENLIKRIRRQASIASENTNTESILNSFTKYITLCYFPNTPNGQDWVYYIKPLDSDLPGWNEQTGTIDFKKIENIPPTIAVWPAQKMPTNFFARNYFSDEKGKYTAWRCTITNPSDWNGSAETYEQLWSEKRSKINVTMTREKDGMTWHINNSNESDGCIIFDGKQLSDDIGWRIYDFPKMYDGDILHVTVEGTSEGTITYDIEFFALDKEEKTNDSNVITMLEKNKIVKTELKKTKADKKSYKAKSSNKKVATISSKGVITAKKPGTATITVTKADKTFEYTIEVVQKPKLIFDDTFLMPGQTISISEHCTISNNHTTITPIKYTSSKPSVASIDEKTGVITISKEGKTKITVYYAIKGKDGALKTITTKGKLVVRQDHGH